MEHERKKLQALQDIGVLLGSTFDLEELLDVLLDRICDVMDADRATLYLLDDDSGELFSKIDQGEHIVEIRLKVGEGLAGSVAQTGQTLNLTDAYQDVRFDAEWDRQTGYRTRSVLCVPLRNQHGRIIGVIQVLNKRLGDFNEGDEALLNALSAQAAVSIENSRLFLSVVGKNMELLEIQEQLQNKIRELDVLFEIAQVSASALELDELLKGVLARTVRAVHAEVASLIIVDEITEELHFRAAAGGPENIKRLRAHFGENVSRWVVEHGKPKVVNPVSENSSVKSASLLCVPLRWDEGERIGVGVVELFNKAQGQGRFTDDDVKLATVIAGHISTAIEQAYSRQRREREDRLSTLGQFLSSVLHDLKTPMTVIKGYVGMLADEGDQEARKNLVEIVLRHVETLDAMTRETLAFARGESTLWIRKVYLYQFFGDLAQQLRHAFGEKLNIELELRNRGVAYFDAPKIQRAVHNLARNAAEAMSVVGQQGTFRLIVDQKEGKGHEPPVLLMTFEDNGPGIPETMRKRLFTPFATHGKKGGTGLGLAIVRRVVDDHAGKIAFESEPGRTVFVLSLPQLPANLRSN